MKISFDEQADALYIQFQRGAVKKTVKVQDGILLDIDQEGHLYGIEILDASHRIPMKDIGKVSIDLPIRVAV